MEGEDRTNPSDQSDRQKSVADKEQSVVYSSSVSSSGAQDVFTQDSVRECRICLLSEQADDLAAPCGCTGSVKYAHLACLRTWCAEKKSLVCELCGQEYAAAYREKLASAIAQPQQSVVVLVQPPPSARQPPGSWLLLCCHAILLLSLLVGVVYLAIFINTEGYEEFWALFVWRVLTIIVPIYLLGRVAFVVYHRRRYAQLWTFGS